MREQSCAVRDFSRLFCDFFGFFFLAFFFAIFAIFSRFFREFSLAFALATLALAHASRIAKNTGVQNVIMTKLAESVRRTLAR